MKLLLPVVFLAGFGCKQLFTKPKFTVVTPAGWTRNDTTGGLGTDVTYLINQKTDEVAGLIIVFSPDLKAFIKAFIADLKTKASIFEIEGEGEILFQKQKVKWLRCHIFYKSTEANVEQKFFFIQKGSYILNVSFTTPEGQLSEMQPIIDQVIQSIRFK